MGIKMTNSGLEELKDGLGLLVGDDRAKVDAAEIAVRTERGIDETFYVDMEGGRFLVTPESFYRRKRKGGKPKADATLTAKERKHLADLYLALVGVASECGEEFFDSYHRRGGKCLFNELEAILARLASEELAALSLG